MEEINRLARNTVFRACGYAAVAIAAVMAGLSYNPRLAFQMGGILCLVLALVLILKTTGLDTSEERSTERIGLQPEPLHGADSQLRRMVSTALKDAYFLFARHAAAVSGTLLAISLCLGYLVA
ncbi:hypothetical protein [Aquabacter cavernae]|uniref:hypothetical protein n=1 Tax=Aquabacter cavernae TaxID=2496029 RepID=UPI000F8E8002|nr:hypothetical protein [Aquabacter cavernae]